MKSKGKIVIEGAQLPEGLSKMFASIHVEFDVEYTLDEAKGLFELAKNSHELVDSLAEGARKFIKYQEEFKDCGLSGCSCPNCKPESAEEAVMDEDIAAAMEEIANQH